MYRICRISSTIADDGCDWFRGKVYGLKLGERCASDLASFSAAIRFSRVAIHGLAARLLDLLFVALSIASGAGMLRRRVEAHALAVGYFAFALLNVFFYILQPSSFVRFMQEVPGGQNLPAGSMHAFFLMSNVLGLLTTSLMLWFLVTRRQRFIAACVG